MPSDRLILCDFDGTVSANDTLSHLSRRFSPEVFAQVEHQMHSREMTLREVLAAEMGGIHEPLEEVVAAAIEGVPMREGFPEFLAGARARDERVILLSAGFRQLIEPMLATIGVRDVELIANDIDFAGAPNGGVITWRELPVCDQCGQECKRGDVAGFRAQYREIVYIGDGFSDRCAAETADLIFARAGLAKYLDGLGEPYVHFDDFIEIHERLEAA